MCCRKSGMMMNDWEVWFANVVFEDNPALSKQRPVVIVDNQTAYIISLKVTSHSPRSIYPGEYALKEWKAAGLSKPSTVRCSKKLRLIPSDFIRKIGRLHPIDVFAIRNIIRNNQ